MHLPKFLFPLLLLYSSLLFGQDTNFLRKHIFKSPVRDVFKIENSVYVKTGDGLYKWENEKWELQQYEFDKPYLFYNKGFFETDYIPVEYRFDASSMAYLIPQQAITLGTKTQMGERLFVSVGGSLFEYHINQYYSHYYKDLSVRDIYLEKNFKVMSTYAGIYINDSVRVLYPNYSSGAFCKVRGNYYLCSDDLFHYAHPFNFRRLDSAMSTTAGLYRKLVEFKNSVYALCTLSFDEMDTSFMPKIIHQGYEYTDLEKVDSAILFSTATGKVFRFNGRTISELFDINTRIRDIYSFKNILYLSTDKGLFTIKDLKIITLRLLAELPFCLEAVVDINENIWMATENGLYILPKNSKLPIPYISEVEFNRGGLTYYNDTIYAGSTSGLYVVDVYSAFRDFLPKYLNKIKVESERKSNLGAILFIIDFVLLAFGIMLIQKQYILTHLLIPHKEPGFTLDELKRDILLNNIQTVDALADFYDTNPVQLNRVFKSHQTTPGKFLRKVKFEIAKELLDEGRPLEEVALRVGYSASFLKKEFQKSEPS